MRLMRRGSTSASRWPPGATSRSSVPCSRASSYIDSIASPARCTRLVGSVVSVTEPASYRLISSRSASSRSNRSVCVCSSSTVRDVGPGKSSRWPYSTSPASRIVVSGVRSSCETSETNRCCMTRQLGELADARLQALGHAVEGCRERRELVLAALGHPHAEVARREPPAGRGGRADRLDDAAHHDERDGAEQREQCGGPDDAGDLHERERLLRLGEVVADVELVAAGGRHLEVAADDDARGRAAVGVRQRDGLPVLAAGVVLHLLAELGRDHPAAEARAQPVGRRHRDGRLARLPEDRDVGAARDARDRADRRAPSAAGATRGRRHPTSRG